MSLKRSLVAGVLGARRLGSRCLLRQLRRPLAGGGSSRRLAGQRAQLVAGGRKLLAELLVCLAAAFRLAARGQLASLLRQRGAAGSGGHARCGLGRLSLRLGTPACLALCRRTRRLLRGSSLCSGGLGTRRGRHGRPSVAVCLPLAARLELAVLGSGLSG